MAFLAFLMAVVIDTPATEPPTLPAAAPHIYLKPPPANCDTDPAADEVLVCSQADLDARYRLKPVDGSAYQDKPVRAETKIGKATVALRADPRKADDAQDDVRFKHTYDDLRLRFILPF